MRTVAGVASWVVAAAGLVAGRLTAGLAVWAWAEREPLNTSRATLTTATTHSTTAPAAIAAPGLPRILPHLKSLIVSAKLACRTRSALRRYMGVSGVFGEQSSITSSRSPAGGAASGSSPDSNAGRSAPRGSAPRFFSSWLRARDVRAYASLHDTPSTVARSLS